MAVFRAVSLSVLLLSLSLSVGHTKQVPGAIDYLQLQLPEVVHPYHRLNASADSFALPRAARPDLMNLTFQHQEQTYTVQQSLTMDNTQGFLVLHRGQVVLEYYHDAFDSNRLYPWASMSTSVLGVAMGILEDQGKVDTGLKVSHYLPELRNTYLGDSLIRHLLGMTTALDHREAFDLLPADSLQALYLQRTGQLGSMRWSEPGVRTLLGRLQQRPGISRNHTFEYQSPNADVIGWLIERISGQSLPQFVSEQIWTRLGTGQEAAWLSDSEQAPLAAQGFASSLEDLARFGEMIRNRGKANGHQLVSHRWVESTLSLSLEQRLHSQRSLYLSSKSPLFDRYLEGYKNFWWIHDGDLGILSARGQFGQLLYIDQSRELVIALFSEADQASNLLRPGYKLKLDGIMALSRAL